MVAKKQRVAESKTHYLMCLPEGAGISASWCDNKRRVKTVVGESEDGHTQRGFSPLGVSCRMPLRALLHGRNGSKRPYKVFIACDTRTGLDLAPT